MHEGQGGDTGTRGGSGRTGRRVRLVASALALLLAVCLASLVAEPSRTCLFNRALELGGLDASADSVFLGGSPPRVELAGLRLRASLSGFDVSAQVPRCTLERRDGPSGPLWILTLLDPKVEAIPGPPVVQPGPGGAALPALPASLRLAVDGASLRLALPHGEAWAHGVRVEAGADGGFSLEGRCGGSIQKKPGPASGQGALYASGRLDAPRGAVEASFRFEEGNLVSPLARGDFTVMGKVAWEDGAGEFTDLALDVSRVSVGSQPWNGAAALAALPPGLTAAVRASARYEAGRISLDVASASLPGLLEASGQARAGVDAAPEIRLRASVRDAAVLLPVAAALAPGLPGDLAVSGPLDAEAAFDPSREGLDGLAVSVRAQGLTVRRPSLGVAGTASVLAKQDASGIAGRAAFSGDIARADLRLPGLSGEASFSGTLGALRLQGLRVALPAGGSALGMTLPEATAQGEGVLDCLGGPPAGTVTGRLRLEGVGEAEVQGEVIRGGRDAARLVSVRGGVSLAGLSALFRGPLQALKPRGECQLEARSADPAGNALDVSGTFRDVRLDLPDGTGEARGLTGAFQARVEPGEPPRAVGTATLGAGSLAVGRAPVDFSRLPLRVQGQASLERGGSRIRFETNAALARLVRVRARGGFDRAPGGWSATARARVELDDLGAALALAVPSGTDPPRVSGRVRLDVRAGGRLAAPELAGSGVVEIDSLEASPGVTAVNLRVPVRLEKDLLRLWDARTPSLSFNVLGGVLEVSHPEVARPLAPDFEAACSATLRGLPLKELTRGRVDAAASGDWARASLTRGMFALDGELKAPAFGGEAIVKGVMVANPFEARRQVRLHAGLLGADLERLSALSGVGRITGRCNITLSELHVAGFLPLSFTLRAESTPVPGVEQRISLGAVNSLTEVSAGRAVDPGFAARTALRLFGDFGYARLGLMVGLKGAYCTVRGLHHEDGVEYVLKRSGLTGVDVVIGNPENAMPFADLLARLRNIRNKGLEAKARPEAPGPPAAPSRGRAGAP